jgi:hypothetical protein
LEYAKLTAGARFKDVTARLAVVLAALVTAAAGCGGEEEPATTPAPAASTQAPPADAPAATPSAANAYIGSLAADPAGGTLLLGTGVGLYRIEGGARRPRRVVGELRAPGGAGPVSSNLVVRYAGPGELLASGHPEGATELPEDLGLMRSADAGATWRPVSELGESDFHILQARGDHVVAVRVEETDVLVSRDGGRAFEVRTPPDTPVDVAFDPDDPSRMVVVTAQGTFTSDDEGRSWRPRDPIPSSQLAWPAAGELYRVDPGGAIKVSGDGGASWEERGTVGLDVSELAADGEGGLLAAVPGGEVRRSTDGGASWERYLKLR